MLHDLASLTADEIRLAFHQASDTFVTTVSRITEWEAPGLGEWTVRELAAHTLRAYTTIEVALHSAPMVHVDVPDATTYFRTALADPAVHAGVAQRGRDGGAELLDPHRAAQTTAARVLAVVDSTEPAAPCETFVGHMPFAQYLAGRVVELTIHTTDLQVATGQPLAIGDLAARVTLAVVAPLADEAQLIRGITGRTSLHVLG